MASYILFIGSCHLTTDFTVSTGVRILNACHYYIIFYALDESSGEEFRFLRLHSS